MPCFSFRHDRKKGLIEKGTTGLASKLSYGLGRSKRDCHSETSGTGSEDIKTYQKTVAKEFINSLEKGEEAFKDISEHRRKENGGGIKAHGGGMGSIFSIRVEAGHATSEIRGKS